MMATYWSLLGIILFVLGHSDALFVCPTPCSCDDDYPGDADFARLVVDCRRKMMTYLPSFDGLAGTPIYRLFLDMNEITELPSHAFRNLSVRGIQMADNPLTNVSVTAFAGLGNSLEYLSLRRTKLTVLPRVFTSGLNRLQVLDLGEIKTPIFSHITSKAFGTLPDLEELVLKSNEIAKIEPDGFLGLQSVMELDLGGNKLTEVPEAVLTLTNLYSLHLDHNPIAAVSSGAFRSLTGLKTISLTDTRLINSSAIDKNAFIGASKSLRSLQLGYNNLHFVPCDALQSLVHLEELKLEEASISHVDPGCFSFLEKLKLLDLSGNFIQFNADTLKGIEDTIEVLKLQRLGLNLENLPLEALKKLQSLNNLDLSGNNFKIIPSKTFEGLSIRTLHLNYCKISVVHREAFQGLKASVEVNMNNNEIANVTFVEDKCLFKRVELHRNPVECSCGVYHVVRYGITTFVGECASPSHYEGVKLNELRNNREIVKECGSGGGVNDTILCFWQLTNTETGSASKAHVGAGLLHHGLLLLAIYVL